MKEIIKFGDIDSGALEQAKKCLNEAEAFCLMADNHKGYGMPVGGVAVYKDKISPAGVGFDIACGNKAVRLNIKRKDLPEDYLSNIKEINFDIKDKIKYGLDVTNHITSYERSYDLNKMINTILSTLKGEKQYNPTFETLDFIK